MERRATSGITLTLLLISMLTLAFGIPLNRAEPCTAYSSDSLSPSYYETSEFLIGSVAVGIIFPESNGSIDPSTENWSSYEESLVITKITQALNWWAGYNPSAHVSFSIEVHYRVPTSYEPITRSMWDYYLWIPETIGYPKLENVFDYTNDLRNRLDTDWAFLIFVVDSSNDVDGKFAGGYYALGDLGGPFFIMTYDGPYKGGITRIMPFMTAHETCHMFWASEEYNGVREYSGYLNVSDNDYANCLMYGDIWKLCNATQEQIGWRDTDGDGVLDIVDTVPDTTLNAYLPYPTSNNILVYTGFVAEVPYPNRNPYRGSGGGVQEFRTRRNITINTITNVEYRIDYGVWKNATATDGAFDEAQEDFTFTTPSLTEGSHVIEVRGKNSVGNTETEYATDIVTIISPVTASVNIHPDALNLRSKGHWITAYIELPEGYDPADIDACTILLNGSISPVLDPKYGFVTDPSGYLVDHNNDGILERMVKFDRAAVESLIFNQGIRYGNIALTITGTLSDETPFEGTDVVFVNYAGDVNNDGIVSVLDAAAVSACWYPGPPKGPLGYDADADLNKDGKIDILDSLIVSVNWEQKFHKQSTKT